MWKVEATRHWRFEDDLAVLKHVGRLRSDPYFTDDTKRLSVGLGGMKRNNLKRPSRVKIPKIIFIKSSSCDDDSVILPTIDLTSSRSTHWTNAYPKFTPTGLNKVGQNETTTPTVPRQENRGREMGTDYMNYRMVVETLEREVMGGRKAEWIS
jgi:hypothetical protein